MPRIGGILYNSLVNGKGTRMVIFFAGCSHKCKGCHNQSLWHKKSGVERDNSEIYAEIIKNIPLIDGITLSGGEPFEQPQDAADIANFAKSKGLNVWTYTGYTLEQLKDMAMHDKEVQRLLQNTDVLVDGKFVEGLKDENLEYRGSSNQRIIHLHEEA